MARKGRWWENHLTQILLTKPAEVVQEACQVLEKHGYPVKKELKSELYCSSTLCQVVFQVLHYANLKVAHAPTAWTTLVYVRLHCLLNNACQIIVRPCTHAQSHAHVCTCTYPRMHIQYAHKEVIFGEVWDSSHFL